MIDHLSDELLSAHLDGALDPSELAAVEAHLASCADCGRRLQLLGATSRAVAGLPDEEPGPLDLSFLPAAVTNIVTLPPARGWRPPLWAAPVLAAAAVLVVAGGVGTLMLRQPTAGSSGAATALGQPAQRFSGPLGPSGGSVAGGLAAGADRAVPGAAPSPGAASAGGNRVSPFDALAGPAATSTRQFPGSGGATVTLSAGSADIRHGQGMQVSMSVSGGSSAVEASGLQVSARRANESALVLGSGAQTVPAGHSATLYGTWVAGQLSGEGTAPGDYRLEAHVLLADGGDLTVNLTVHVS